MTRSLYVSPCAFVTLSSYLRVNLGLIDYMQLTQILLD